MSLSPRLSLAALVVLAAVAAPAAAQSTPHPYTYLMAGIGGGTMNVQSDSNHVGTADWMAGFRVDQYWGFQFAGHGATNPFHQALQQSGVPLYDFNRYTDVELVGYLPATSAWDITGTVGVGRATYGTAEPGFGPEHKTDSSLGAGVRWQVVPHLAVSTNLSRVINAQSFWADARVEVNF